MSTNPPISRPTGLVNYNEKGSLGCGKPSGTLPATDAGAKSLIIGRAWTLADKKPAKREGNRWSIRELRSVRRNKNRP